MKNIVSLLACWFAVLVSVPAGQQLHPRCSPPSVQGVDAVQLDVSVLDKERRPVRGLTAADFTVLEDGKPRGDRCILGDRAAANASRCGAFRRRHGAAGRLQQRRSARPPRHHSDRPIPGARDGARPRDHRRPARHHRASRDGPPYRGQSRSGRPRRGGSYDLWRAAEFHDGQGPAQTSHR